MSDVTYVWLMTRTNMKMKKVQRRPSSESEFKRVIAISLRVREDNFTSVLHYAAPDRGFHPGPSRRRWRDWLRLHRSNARHIKHTSPAAVAHCDPFACAEVRSRTVPRCGPEDAVPDGRGVQEERPL